MIQGSNMTRSHKGMRKGMSLLELLMAIVLLGILAGLGYKYYKIYYDTSFAVKQAKIYLIMEQAAQLSGAHDLFETKNAIVPNTLFDMVWDRQLKEIPGIPLEMSKEGWKLKTYQTFNIYDDKIVTSNATYSTYDQNGTYDGNISLAGTTADNDIAFTFKLDGNNTAKQDLLDYCNIVNNTGERRWGLRGNNLALDTLGATPTQAYTSATSGTVSTSYFCYDQNSSTDPGNYEFEVVFVKLVDPA